MDKQVSEDKGYQIEMSLQGARNCKASLRHWAHLRMYL